MPPQTQSPRKKILMAICLIGLAVIVALVLIYGGKNPGSTASLGHLPKHLRPLPRYSSKPLCGVARKGYAQCAAYVATGQNSQPAAVTPGTTSLNGPVQFHTAYQLPCTPGGPVQGVCAAPSSFGPTIAIVDAGSYGLGTGTIDNSLNFYDNYYGLPACTTSNGCLTVVNQSGAASPLPANIDDSWSHEIALDVQAAHMVCQTCKIVLVEANDNAIANLVAATTTAATFNPVAISESWFDSTGDDTTFDSKLNIPGTAVVAAAGDSGSANVDWPADSPNVIAAAGTTLQLNTDNSWAAETVWSSSGGTCSKNYTAPAWQTNLSNWGSLACGAKRSFGDVSADADPNSGAYIWMGTDTANGGSWWGMGGTSLSSPIIASIFGLVGKVPTSVQSSAIPYGSFTAANFHDITGGSNCANSLTGAACTAAAGFDTPSGLGSPLGAGGFSPPPAAPTNLHQTSATDTGIGLAWTAATGNVAISGYHIYRNGTLIATQSGTSFSDSGLSKNTSYTYAVSAYDALGNISAQATASLSTAKTGDLNGDGQVNATDLNLFLTNYSSKSANLDLNGDGNVDVLDLSVMLRVFGS